MTDRDDLDAIVAADRPYTLRSAAYTVLRLVADRRGLILDVVEAEVLSAMAERMTASALATAEALLAGLPPAAVVDIERRRVQAALPGGGATATPVGHLLDLPSDALPER